MRNVAALIIIIGFVFAVLLAIWPHLINDYPWQFRRSPHTQICYEEYTFAWWTGLAISMSPVDDSYCEEER